MLKRRKTRISLISSTWISYWDSTRAWLAKLLDMIAAVVCVTSAKVSLRSGSSNAINSHSFSVTLSVNFDPFVCCDSLLAPDCEDNRAVAEECWRGGRSCGETSAIVRVSTPHLGISKDELWWMLSTGCSAESDFIYFSAKLSVLLNQKKNKLNKSWDCENEMLISQ